MEPIPYTVLKIDGDYAILQRTDLPDSDTVLMARALLPEEITDGTKLVMENFCYTIVE
ncbi:MAG: chorismate--pyruvate lyase [Oscillospiraceae bacterium]|nr:chorismate--pyruvate lyase [Oscillospiraceae bacterium]